VNLFSAAFPAAARVSKIMNTSIPVYQADGSLYACVSEQRLARLQSAGLVARVVRDKDHVNRAILFFLPGSAEAKVGQFSNDHHSKTATARVARFMPGKTGFLNLASQSHGSIRGKNDSASAQRLAHQCCPLQRGERITTLS